MSLRLICGRSGTGKSEFCLNEVIDKLNNENKIYIITPEQFSYSVEKKLIEKTKFDAIINAEVLTFKRMAYRVQNEVGGVTDINLSKAGKAMLIYSILLDNKNNLKFLGKSEQNVDLVETALTEFKKHNISLRELSRRADIDIARLSELSSGKRQRINIEYIERIAEALDINDIREILTIEDK